MTLIDRMNELLEAERSGIIVYEQMSFLSPNKGINRMFAAIRNNEALDCEILHSLISQRDVRPSDNMNGFADKVMALEDEKERLALVLRGLAWVVRKIDELPGEELTQAEQDFFRQMRGQHLWNIGSLRELLQEMEKR